MWNSLYGEITYKTSDRLYLLVGGMEWCLYVSGNTLSHYASSKGIIRIWTYLQHKEEEMTLFGFYEEREREMFLSLLSVNGIGAKASLRVLSTFNPDRLQSVLESEDINALSTVKGLGKKTAQKILLALKGKIVWAEDSLGSEDYWIREIQESLVNMGFDAKRVQIIIKDLLKDSSFSTLPLEEREKFLFSQAVLSLSQS